MPSVGLYRRHWHNAWLCAYESKQMVDDAGGRGVWHWAHDVQVIITSFFGTACGMRDEETEWELLTVDESSLCSTSPEGRYYTDFYNDSNVTSASSPGVYINVYIDLSCADLYVFISYWSVVRLSVDQETTVSDCVYLLCIPAFRLFFWSARR